MPVKLAKSTKQIETIELNDLYLLEKMKDKTYTVNFGTKGSLGKDKKTYFIEVLCARTKEADTFYLLSKKEYDGYFNYYQKLQK